MEKADGDGLAAAYEGRRVVVTGGMGAIGRHLTAALVQLGAHVTVLDNMSTPSLVPAGLLAHERLRPVRRSILDDEGLRSAVTPGTEVVFHLAALFANRKSVEQPHQDLLVNGLGTLRLLLRAQDCGVSRFVYVSSASVYKDNLPLITEASPVGDFGTPYQITKYLGELYTGYLSTAGLPTVVVRLFSSYGPGELPGPYRNVVANFIYRALRGEELRISGTGTETRPYTYVGDHVHALLRGGVLDEAEGEVFNSTNERTCSVEELADLVLRATSSSAPIVKGPQREWDTRLCVRASGERMRQRLGFEPRVPLEEGLARTVAWHREHQAEIERLVAAQGTSGPA
jgi:nucleoside-diphosphate-sugar epimerase